MKSKTQKKVSSRAKKNNPSPKNPDSVPIIAIGASAGGIDALERFFKEVPQKPNVCFIVVMHLAPDHRSILPDLLQKISKIRVAQIIDKTFITANCIYVIPPGNDLTIEKDQLFLTRRKHLGEGLTLGIDFFFKSLARYQGKKVAIILSGAGEDGKKGILHVRMSGGLTVAQDPATAQYSGMPTSAIETNQIDLVLSPKKMWTEIKKHLQNEKSFDFPHDKKEKETQDYYDLEPIFQQLQTNIGHDFSLYKYNTICRRIEKRMSYHKISSIAEYTRYLKKTPKEAEILFKDMLINVTNFFRDPEAFYTLEECMIKYLKKNR